MRIDHKAMPDPMLRFDIATNRFVLTEDYVTPEITVPKGEYTDGATIPKGVELIIDRYDRHLPACIVHDYMYRNAVVSKAYADDIFHRNLLRCGMTMCVANAMYHAVLAFGKGSY